MRFLSASPLSGILARAVPLGTVSTAWIAMLWGFSAFVGMADAFAAAAQRARGYQREQPQDERHDPAGEPA